MTPVSQLIWRNRSRLDASVPMVLVAPPADELGPRMAQEGFKNNLLCLSFAAHVRARAASISSGYGLCPPEGERWGQVIVFQPREKALLDMLLDLARATLAPGGALWLAGENRAGIKSAGKRLADHFSRWEKTDNARHCTLFRADGPIHTAPFDLQAHITQWPLEIAGTSLTVQSLPGVFAHGRLDAGTRLLLESLATSPAIDAMTGRVLDFACGSGVIAAVLASKQPDASFTLLDDFAPALESARRTLEYNGLDGALVASDGLAELLTEPAPTRFDWIVSNPPFHRGVSQALETANRFVRDSRRLLAPGGRLCLVANQHLPYGRWLPELYADVQVLAADREYNVWLASGQPRPE